MPQPPPDELPGMLPALDPSFDPPLDLPDVQDAARGLAAWLDNTGTLSPAVRAGSMAATVAGGWRATLIGGVPTAIGTQVVQELGDLDAMRIRVGYAAALALSARFAGRAEGEICGPHVACEAVRMVDLVVSGHVRRFLRVRHPFHDYWRRITVDVLLSSRTRTFRGELAADRRVLDRVAAVEADAAAEAAVAGLTGQRRA